jgi:hypothetical protein
MRDRKLVAVVRVEQPLVQHQRQHQQNALRV